MTKRNVPDPFQPELPFGSPQTHFRGLPWFKNIEKTEPTSCPHCHQPTNVYRRPISAIVARTLIKLYYLDQRDPEKPWHHIKELYRDRGDWAKLKFFGLIEEAANDNVKKKTSGLWKITEAGRNFVLGKIHLPKYALVRWNSELIGFAGNAVTIRICVEAKNQFSYDKLMNEGIVFVD